MGPTFTFALNLFRFFYVLDLYIIMLLRPLYSEFNFLFTYFVFQMLQVLSIFLNSMLLDVTRIIHTIDTYLCLLKICGMQSIGKCVFI